MRSKAHEHTCTISGQGSGAKCDLGNCLKVPR